MKLKIARFLDEAVLYAVYGVVFFIPISISAVGIFAGIAILSFLVKQALSVDLNGIKDNKALFLLLLLFFAFMGLSLFNSGPLFAKSLKALLIKWGRFPLLLWVMIDTLRDTRRIIGAVHVLVFSAALVGLTVFTQKFFGFEFLRGRVLESFSTPSTGPFKNQNSLAAYSACVAPVVLAVSMWKKEKIVTKLALFMVTGLLILSLAWATSRGGWLGLITGLFFIILVTNSSRIKKVFWPVLLSSYLFFMPLVVLALLFYKGRLNSNSERLTIISGAWRMIKEHPLIGKGLGTFMDYCAAYTNNIGVYYAHNCYLQMWAESGIFSLISFLLIAGYVFYGSINAILKMPAKIEFYILTGLTAGLLGYLAHAFFDVHLYSFELSFLFWVVLGLTVALTQRMRTPAA